MRLGRVVPCAAPNRHELAIPNGVVTTVEDDPVELALSKDEVGALERVNRDRRHLARRRDGDG